MFLRKSIIEMSIASFLLDFANVGMGSSVIGFSDVLFLFNLIRRSTLCYYRFPSYDQSKTLWSAMDKPKSCFSQHKYFEFE